MRLKIATVIIAAGGGDTLVNAPPGIFGTIIVLGAVIGALWVIWGRAVRPGIKFGRKLTRAVDVLLELPDRQEKLDKWQIDVTGRLESLEAGTTARGKRTGRGLAHPNEP